MLKLLKNHLLLLCGTLLIICLASCSTTESPPKPIDINGKFIKNMSDKMMRSLLNSNILANAKKTPRIALIKFRNISRFPMPSRIFLAKLRADLNSKAQGRITFLDRSHIKAIKSERSMKRKGVFSFTQGSLKQAVSGADYFLTGKLYSHSGGSNKGARSDYVLFTFYLVNSENSDILWEDQFELEFDGNINIIYQ